MGYFLTQFGLNLFLVFDCLFTVNWKWTFLNSGVLFVMFCKGCVCVISDCESMAYFFISEKVIQ